MTTLPRLGAAALLLASVSTLALLAHNQATATESAPMQRLAQADKGGPPPEQKGEAAPQGEQQDEAPDENGKKKRGKKKDDGDQGGQQGPPPEQKGERKERGRDRDQNGGREQGPPREKREPQREEKPSFKKKEPQPPMKEQAPPSFKPKELPSPKATPREPVEPEQKKIETPKAPPKLEETPKSVEPPPATKKHEEPPKSDNGNGAGKTSEPPPKGTNGPDANGKWKGDRDKPSGPQGAPDSSGAPPASKLAPVEAPTLPAAKQLPPGESATPRPPPNESETQRVERHRKSFEQLKQQRREVKEDGGKRTVIEEPDKRRIIREDGKSTIRHDETERFKRLYRDTREERGSDGNNITIVIGPGGIRILTEVDRDGRTLRRWRRARDGRETVLFDNRSYYRRFGDRRPSFLDAIVNLAPPVVRIPRDRYIVEYDRASEDDIYETLSAPPVDDIDHPYSLEEIRQSPYLRDRMRRLDLDTITFDFGSWEVDPRDYGRLERLARVMNRILARNPDEMFLIEGHTDAVGSDEDNLTLSDRRAETVALILSEEFGVPAENLTTQGYGEQFLKVPTDGPERLNRRTAARRITPLLAR
jgi:outer membrane protein OmpA-like peptidoglycan-associated protein